MMQWDHLAGLAVTALLCAACAAVPPASQPVVAPPTPEVENFHPTEHLLALAPGRHAYVRQQIPPAYHHGDATQPAWIKLTRSNSHSSSEVVISSGNPSFDQAALNLNSATTVEYAGGDDTPAITMVCIFFDNGCPVDSPWKDGSTLRSMTNIQEVFDRGKKRLIDAYSSAVRQGRIAGAGMIVLSLTIAPTGSVEQCSIEQSTYSNEFFLQKILNTACGFNFGAADVVSTTVRNYPIEFHPM